ncbi:MAG: hypothetical protein ACK5DD_15395 [Cyclobacteriaceae bacterium]
MERYPHRFDRTDYVAWSLTAFFFLLLSIVSANLANAATPLTTKSKYECYGR